MLMIFTQARMLLKSLVMIGALCGLIFAVSGTTILWLLPKLFSPDPQVIKQVRYCHFICHFPLC